MFLSFHSLSSFLCSRPPLALFILSLFALTVTTFSLALYCRSSSNLKNVDVLDWNKLFTEMTDLKFCLKKNVSETDTSEIFNDANVTYIATMANVPINTNLVAFLSKEDAYFSGEGIVPLNHIGLGHQIGDSVRVKIQQEKGQIKACVRVETVQMELIDHLRNSTIGNDNACIDNTWVTKNFTVHSKKHLPHYWCQEREDIIFRWDFKGREDWTTFLTMEEREVLYVHLLATTAVLGSIIFCLLVWAAAKGTVAGARRAGDMRGDMQLLSSDGVDDDGDF